MLNALQPDAKFVYAIVGAALIEVGKYPASLNAPAALLNPKPKRPVYKSPSDVV